jgi:hypothetical protein
MTHSNPPTVRSKKPASGGSLVPYTLQVVYGTWDKRTATPQVKEKKWDKKLSQPPETHAKQGVPWDKPWDKVGQKHVNPFTFVPNLVPDPPQLVHFLGQK